jgi:CheY-like chemotaxis protein
MMVRPHAELVEVHDAAATDPSAGPATALVIDDEPRDAARTRRWLTDAGYATVAAADGDAVLRLVRDGVIRLVVSELYVPCAEGRCVVAALTEDRARHPWLRVLAHSRHTTSADDAWARAARCDGIYHKPGCADAFLVELRKLGGTHLAGAEAKADNAWSAG